MNPIVFENIRTVLSGVQEALVQLARDFGTLIDDLIDAFPNPFGMIDAIFLFTTGLVGRILAIPFQGLQKRIQDMLRRRNLHNKLMRADKAVELAFVGPVIFLQEITLTRGGGFLDWLATTAARWAWMTFKNWKFLWKLTQVKNEAELIKLYVDKVTKRIGFIRIAGLIIGAFAVLCWAGAQLAAIGLAVGIWDGTVQKMILPQDSKRKRVKVIGTVEKRMNVRTGPDSTNKAEPWTTT